MTTKGHTAASTGTHQGHTRPTLLQHAHIHVPRSPYPGARTPGSSPCGTRLCTDWAFWSPARGRAGAIFLGAQLLSRLLRRRGNSTGAAAWGPELPGEGSTSGGAPGGVAPLPFSCSPDTCDTWSGLDVRATLGEGKDGSLQGERVQKKVQRRLGVFLHDCQMLSQTERHQERTSTKQDRVRVRPLVPEPGVQSTLRGRREEGYILCQVQEPQVSRAMEGGGCT